MTLHITYDHPCPQCGAEYIPYDADVPCPNCGLVEAERFDYIPLLVESALFNMSRFGGYVPPVWWDGSLGDQIALRVFSILTRRRRTKENTLFSTVAREAVESMDWGDRPYAKDHVYRIACRVYEEIEKRPHMPFYFCYVVPPIEDPVKWRHTYHTGIRESARDDLLGRRHSWGSGESEE